MERDDYERAVALMKAHPNLQDFAGPRTEELVQAAEQALALSVPDIYRRFLLEYGAGNFGSAEVFGVIDSRFTDSSVPNGIWYTLAERERSGLSPHLIVIGNDGTGNLICLDCRDEAASVVLVDPSGERTQATRIASGFGSYLLKAVTAEIET